MRFLKDWLGLALFLAVVLFFLWCLRVTNPKHPSRLERLRKKLGVGATTAKGDNGEGGDD